MKEENYHLSYSTLVRIIGVSSHVLFVFVRFLAQSAHFLGYRQSEVLDWVACDVLDDLHSEEGNSTQPRGIIDSDVVLDHPEQRAENTINVI